MCVSCYSTPVSLVAMYLYPVLTYECVIGEFITNWQWFVQTALSQLLKNRCATDQSDKIRADKVVRYGFGGFCWVYRKNKHYLSRENKANKKLVY